MKDVLVNLMLIIGVVLLTMPILNTWWNRYRILRFREDVYGKRDALFDIAAEKNFLWDKPVAEAIEHLSNLAQTADYLSLPLIVSTVPFLPGSTPRENAQDCEMQLITDQWYAWSAKRTLDFLILESLCGRLFLSLALINLHEKEVEQFVRSDATDDLQTLKGTGKGTKNKSQVKPIPMNPQPTC